MAEIAAALPGETPGKRIALLPDLLRAWILDDVDGLAAHRERETQSERKFRIAQLQEVQQKARHLLESIAALTDASRLLIAGEVQLLRELKSRDRIALQLGWVNDLRAGKQDRDTAIAWLTDLTRVDFDSKMPTSKKIFRYLVVLDLAAIFELVTGRRPTRIVNPITQRTYSPFLSFCAAAEALTGKLGSLDAITKDVLKAYGETDYSLFITNLQFRYPALWRKFSI